MRKQGIWLLVAAIFTVIALVFAFSIDKVKVTASDFALKDQGWKANFSTPLKTEALGSDDLYVTDGSGKRMKADITLEGNGEILHVNGLEPGTYTLHVKKSAVDGKFFKSLPVDEIKFTVHETIETVKSAEDLKAYFNRALAVRNSSRQETSLLQEKTEMAADSGAAAKSSGSDHSTTNNQVDGVDEADVVKTDGDYIYTVTGYGKVVITDIRNPKQMTKASEIKMEEGYYPSQLFLHGDTLVVLGDKHVQIQSKIQSNAKIGIMPMNSMTTVRLYDVSNRKNPSLVREIGAEGYLNGARKTGEMLYFVTNVHPNFWIMEDLDEATLRPRVYDSENGDEAEDIAYEDISILLGAIEPSYSVITAIDLSSPTKSDVVTKGYLGGSEQLYMTENNLYLTTTKYDYAATSKIGTADLMIWNPGNANTELFKFTLNGTNVTFHSSAELKGNLLNQFSMDEYNGFLRVVTTEGNMWDDKNPSKNHLFIFDESLKVTGSVEGLAKGERIYSARFMGDKAYMVTFRETDPLFVIDVANPAAPKVLGELKIPGFSNYLHPLDENHLIGFGYDTVAEKNPGGGEPLILTQGMKISLFDVSDFANPKEKDTEIIGGRGTYSPVQYDHKALFQHKGLNLYGFPVMIYEEIGKDHNIDFLSSGALVYEITPENGIVLKGDLLEKKSGNQQYHEWEKEIQRMIYSKDSLYTISMKEIKSYSLDTYTALGGVTIE